MRPHEIHHRDPYVPAHPRPDFLHWQVWSVPISEDLTKRSRVVTMSLPLDLTEEEVAKLINFLRTFHLSNGPYKFRSGGH